MLEVSRLRELGMVPPFYIQQSNIDPIGGKVQGLSFALKL